MPAPGNTACPNHAVTYPNIEGACPRRLNLPKSRNHLPKHTRCLPQEIQLAPTTQSRNHTQKVPAPGDISCLNHAVTYPNIEDACPRRYSLPYPRSHLLKHRRHLPQEIQLAPTTQSLTQTQKVPAPEDTACPHHAVTYPNIEGACSRRYSLPQPRGHLPKHRRCLPQEIQLAHL